MLVVFRDLPNTSLQRGGGSSAGSGAASPLHSAENGIYYIIVCMGPWTAKLRLPCVLTVLAFLAPEKIFHRFEGMLLCVFGAVRTTYLDSVFAYAKKALLWAPDLKMYCQLCSIFHLG
jgi:hypothetical protein